MNIDVATAQMKDFLAWRKKDHVDRIRQDIVYGGKDSPWKFPQAKKIIKLAPQIVITDKALDKKGNPTGWNLAYF
jgi:hypothetical protein